MDIELLNQISNTIDEMLKTLESLSQIDKGGPGSGRVATENVGRVYRIVHTTPRTASEIIESITNARRAVAAARERARRNPNSQEHRNDVGRAEAALRAYEREARALIAQQNRNNGKSANADYTIDSIMEYSKKISSIFSKVNNK